MAPDFKFVLDDSLNYIHDVLTPSEIADASREVPVLRLAHPPTNGDIEVFIAAIAKINRPELSRLMHSAVPLPQTDSYSVWEGSICAEAWRAVVGEDPPK